MIKALLPPEVVGVEAFDDLVDAPLFPEEEVLVAKAVEKRRAEFATARRCAREALAGLGYAPGALLSGPKREPLWPQGVVGSITHCLGYRAAAVARDTDLVSIGIDAEPHEPLPAGVLEAIALPQEQERLRRLSLDEPQICWDRLLFCAKEAVYKAWFPLTHRWLDFHEADIVIGSGFFSATLLVPGPSYGDTMLTGFTGQYTGGKGLLIAAITVPAPAQRSGAEGI